MHDLIATSKRGFRCSLLIIPALCFGTANAWVSVGESPGFGSCDYTTVQAAINSGENEIRILDNQVFQENLLLTGSRTLRGGFTSCLAASLDQQQGEVSEIDGSDASLLPTVSIAVNGTATITLDKLRITGGATGVATGAVDGVLNIRNSQIAANGGFANGGGLFIGNPGDSLQVVLRDSTIIGNSATDGGGGIYCDSDQTSIRLESGGILENFSGGEGGGVFVADGCHFASYAGTRFDDGSVLAGVSFNTAVGSGGGIFAINGATVTLNGHLGPLGLWGNTTDPATLAGNVSGFEGGGIFAAGPDTVVEIIDGDVRGNRAEGWGGGAIVVGGAALTSDLSGEDCWHAERCSRWRGNESEEARGGHIYLDSGGSVSLARGFFSGGRAFSGTAIAASGAGTSVEVEGSYFHDNGQYLPDEAWDFHILHFLDGAEGRLLHTTFGANRVGNSALRTSGSTSSIEVRNSIVFQPGTPVFSSSDVPTISFSCVIGNESESTFGAVDVLDPGFRDAEGGDLRLSVGAGAVDRCIDAGAMLPDSDHDARGWDDPAAPNLGGLFDAGADEQTQGDALFSDRFEA